MLARATDDHVVMLRFPRNAGEAHAGTSPRAAQLLDALRDELAAYFAGDLQRFTIPLAQPGTPFQQRVWHQLTQIPFGETIAYATLARHVCDANAVRAVARANAANALGILVPCHRVIGKDGSLTGFAGGLDAKRALLALERDATALTGGPRLDSRPARSPVRA